MENEKEIRDISKRDESTEALVYRAVTIQILNRIHSVNTLRKIYTFVKYSVERKP